jgi:hypothetical protein
MTKQSEQQQKQKANTHSTGKTDKKAWNNQPQQNHQVSIEDVESICRKIVEENNERTWYEIKETQAEIGDLKKATTNANVCTNIKIDKLRTDSKNQHENSKRFHGERYNRIMRMLEVLTDKKDAEEIEKEENGTPEMVIR